MQFHKNTSTGNQGTLKRILIKVLLVLVLFSILIIVIEKIDFPYPNKKIEKIISNESLKIVK